ncbi:MAG: ABC transporter substrate-binding protein [Waterburya sp.]
MFNKKLKITQKNTIVFFYVLILCLLGPLIVVVNNSEISLPEKIRDKLEPFISQSNKPNSDPVSSKSLVGRISTGDRILITADTNSSKQLALQAYASQDYQTAIEQLQISLKSKPNDPEALIYWNNSLANLKGNPLKIATSVPIGGNLDVSKEILRGVAQAQTRINRNGGINGRLVEVIIGNDDNDPGIGKQIAAEFVKDPEIMAVIGHNDSDVSVAAAPIYEQGKLVMITPTSSADNIAEIGNYIFRATPNARALAETLTNYTIDVARKEDIGICVDSQSAASKSFQKEFTWAIYNRGANIASAQCDFAAANFNPSEIPSKMISSGADALVLAPSVSNVNQAIQIAQANQGRLNLFGSQALNTYATLQQGQKEVNGMVLTVPWYSQSNNKSNNNNTFILDAQKLWGGAVNWRTAMAYDATEAIIAALKTGTAREQISITLSNPLFTTDGAAKAIQFLPSGDRNMKGTLIRVQPGNKSGTGFDFVLVEPEANK